jgi:hypothetical protein
MTDILKQDDQPVSTTISKLDEEVSNDKDLAMQVLNNQNRIDNFHYDEKIYIELAQKLLSIAKQNGIHRENLSLDVDTKEVQDILKKACTLGEGGLEKRLRKYNYPNRGEGVVVKPFKNKTIQKVAEKLGLEQTACQISFNTRTNKIHLENIYSF